jgi:glycosyl transferase family 25
MLVERQLDNTPFHWTFLDAVDGRTLPGPAQEYDQRTRLRLYGYGLTPGEIGCFLSHRNAWKRCSEGTKPMLILEDDFEFRVPLVHLASLLSAIGEALASQSDRSFVRLAAVSPVPTKTLIPLASEYDLVSYAADPSGTAAYLLTPAAAAALLRHSSKFFLPVDDYIAHEYLHGVEGLGVQPYPVSCRLLSSTIEGRQQTVLSRWDKVRREFFRIPFAISRWRYRHRKTALVQASQIPTKAEK